MLRCRPIVNNTFVFFNSAGKNEDGTSIKYQADGTSFAKDTDAVAQSLKQRLSIIKSELWYNELFGIPLFDKMKSKLEADIAVATIVEMHPDVKNINTFTSQIIDKTYSCNIQIDTQSGSLDIQL